MKFQTLSIEEFTSYQKNHPLSNFYQSINYAMLMAECGYDYDLVGLKDETDTLVGASLILIKSIPNMGSKIYYGYAPRGFLIDYHNTFLLETFTTKLKEYYNQKNIIFIKVNPLIPIADINNKTFEPTYNNHKYLQEELNNNGYKKLIDNLYFEAQLPRFSALIDLQNFDKNTLSKNTKNKIRKGIRKGLKFTKVSREYLNTFYQLIKNKTDKEEYYFEDYYTVFSKDDAIDLFLVSINYNEFLQNSQYIYDKELEKNNKLNYRLTKQNSEKVINAKMASDKILLSYKNDIMEATKGMQENKEEFIAGALVIKHEDMVTITFSSFNKEYRRFAPNYFLYYSIIKYYQKDYKYLDLNGVVGDFHHENPYSGLNRFKLGFNPKIVEYLGEFDLIINEKGYAALLKNGTLAKMFHK